MTNFLIGVYKLTRVKSTISFTVILTILGVFLGGQNVLSWKSIVILFANILVVAFIFMINDVEDAEDDAMDLKKVNRNPISAKIMTKKDGYIVTSAVAALSTVLYLALGIMPLIFGISLIIVGFLYSWKKIRLKAFPLLDLLSHAYMLGGGILLVTYLVFYSLSTEIIVPFLAVSFFSLAGDLYNEIRDFDVDRKSRLKNTAQLIGKKTASFLRYFFISLSLLLFFYLIYLKITEIYIISFVVALLIVIGVIAFNIFKSRSLSHFDNTRIYDPILLSISIMLTLSMLITN